MTEGRLHCLIIQRFYCILTGLDDWLFSLMHNSIREVEECEEAKTKSNIRSLRTYLTNGDTDADESPTRLSAEVSFFLQLTWILPLVLVF